MSAKHAKDNDDSQLPASPCLTPGELESVKQAVTATPFDADKVRVIVRPVVVIIGAIGLLGFVIQATFSVTSFMHEARSFQETATAALQANGSAIKDLGAQMAIVTGRQNAVIADRWRFSDMQPWAYQLERANRDVLRENGNKGLVVPEPVAKPQPPDRE